MTFYLHINPLPASPKFPKPGNLGEEKPIFHNLPVSFLHFRFLKMEEGRDGGQNASQKASSLKIYCSFPKIEFQIWNSCIVIGNLDFYQIGLPVIYSEDQIRRILSKRETRIYGKH